MNWFDSRFEMAFPSQPSACLANRWPNIPKRVFDQKFFPTCTADRRWNFDSSIDSQSILPTCKAAAFAFGAVCKARWKVSRRITARASKSSTDWKLWIACLAALPGSLQYGFGLSVLACRGCWTWIFFACFAHILYTWRIYMFCSTQCWHFNVVLLSYAWYSTIRCNQRATSEHLPVIALAAEFFHMVSAGGYSISSRIVWCMAGAFGSLPFGNLWLSILVKSRVLITAFSPRIALLINAQERVLPEEPRVCKSHHRSGMITCFFNDWSVSHPCCI